MQRLIIHGVPYNVDSKHRIFPFDAAGTEGHVQIGTYNAESGTVELFESVKQELFNRVIEWRLTQQPRPRKPVDTANTETATADTATDEDSGAD